MSKYTTQVRWIVENATPNFKGSVKQRIEAACPKIFDFDFPIWSEGYRVTLETKILMHYFNKEICMETVGLWKVYLEERLNLIMPYYNQLYETTARDYDYLWDVNSMEVFNNDKTFNENVKYNENQSVENESSGSNTGKNTTLSSDLPQTNYAGVDYGTNLNELDITGKESNNSSGTSTKTTTNGIDNKSTDKYTRERTGATGSRSLTELMLQYRNSLINIDKLLIEELNDLFMLIY